MPRRSNSFNAEELFLVLCKNVCSVSFLFLQASFRSQQERGLLLRARLPLAALRLCLHAGFLWRGLLRGSRWCVKCWTPSSLTSGSCDQTVTIAVSSSRSDSCLDEFDGLFPRSFRDRGSPFLFVSTSHPLEKEEPFLLSSLFYGGHVTTQVLTCLRL